VSAGYLAQGRQAVRQRQKLARALLANRRLPSQGWDDASIEAFLDELAMMDSNNFLDRSGVGEREGRIYSGIVAKRHYRMSHGIGRSGDIAAQQPKAAGSSLMLQLLNHMILDTLHIAGLTEVRRALVFPTATGLSIAVALLALHRHLEMPQSRRVILWSRIDQKSCFKAMLTAGFEVVIVPPKLRGDQLETDVERFTELLQTRGTSVFCCLTTTSCFAPRAPDNVEAIARICAAMGVAHVVNNAYGLQCRSTMKQLNRAMRVGRVDTIVQSTDKNFLVPVGGAVIAGPDAAIVNRIGKAYPGRASAAPIQDLFITLLSMGIEGYKLVLAEREALVQTFRHRLSDLAQQHGERLLISPLNSISFAVSLSTMEAHPEEEKPQGGGATSLGSMLFKRSVSGTRVVPRDQVATIEGHMFAGFGASVEGYPCSYFTAACALGIREEECELFFKRLEKVFVEIAKKRRKLKEKTLQPPNSSVLEPDATLPSSPSLSQGHNEVAPGVTPPPSSRGEGAHTLTHAACGSGGNSGDGGEANREKGEGQ